MSEKIVCDFYETIVTQPDITKHRVEWRPGAESLLRDIGRYVIIWTADNAHLIQNAVEKYVPSLGGLMREYYGQGKLPNIPPGFTPPPYSHEEMIDIMQTYLSREDIIERRVEGIPYDSDKTFFAAVARLRLYYEMLIGRLKFPPLVGSNILVDDNISGKTLRLRAKQLKFSLIDARSHLSDKKPDAWAERVYRALDRLR